MTCFTLWGTPPEQIQNLIRCTCLHFVYRYKSMPSFLFNLTFPKRITTFPTQHTWSHVLQKIKRKWLNPLPHVFEDVQLLHPSQTITIWSQLKQYSFIKKKIFLEYYSFTFVLPDFELWHFASSICFDWPFNHLMNIHEHSQIQKSW